MTKNKTLIINIISIFLTKCVGFFVVPIYTRLIAPEQYSNIVLFESYVSFLCSFSGLGVTSALSIAKYEFKEDYQYFKISNFVFGLLINFILSILLFIVVSYSQLDISTNLLLLAIFQMISTYIINYIQNVCIFEKKANINLILSIVSTILISIASVFLVVKLPTNINYLGKIYGGLIPSLLISTGILIYYLRQKRVVFNTKYMKFALLLGIPSAFQLLSGSILNVVDKIIMQELNIENAIIGIYGVMVSFSNIFMVIIDAFNNSWISFYYDDLASNDVSINNKCKNYLELITIIACGFMLLSNEVGSLIYGNKYISGLKIIPLLVFSTYCVFLYRFPVNFEYYHRKNFLISCVTFICGIVNIFLNASLISTYGMFGAALSSIISYLLLFVLNMILSNLTIEGGFHIKIDFFIPYLVVVLIFTTVSFYVSNWVIRWAIGVIIGVYEIIRIIKRKSVF